MKRRAGGGGGEEDHLSKRLKIHLELTSLQSQYNVQQEQVKAAKEQVKAAKEQLARLERELASTKEAKSKFVHQRNQIGVQFEPGPPNYPYQVNEAVWIFTDLEKQRGHILEEEHEGGGTFAVEMEDGLNGVVILRTRTDLAPVNESELKKRADEVGFVAAPPNKQWQRGEEAYWFEPYCRAIQGAPRKTLVFVEGKIKNSVWIIIPDQPGYIVAHTRNVGLAS